MGCSIGDRDLNPGNDCPGQTLQFWAGDLKRTPDPEQAAEARWRKQFKAAYANLDRAQKELDILQREDSKAQLQYYSDPQKALAEQYTRKDINDKEAKIAAKKKEIDQIKQQIGDDWSVERLAFELEHAPDYLSVYVAYAGNVAAACAWIRFPPGSPFASLWGGATLPQLRNRGLYTALLAARVQEARVRGWRYVTIDAGHMSRPIVEKRGFRLLTYATACNWNG